MYWDPLKVGAFIAPPPRQFLGGGGIKSGGGWCGVFFGKAEGARALFSCVPVRKTSQTLPGLYPHRCVGAILPHWYRRDVLTPYAAGVYHIPNVPP